MKLLFLVLVCIFSINSNAQSDTLSSNYDLNSLDYGNTTEVFDEITSEIPKEVILKRHKKIIKLTFIVDSLIISNRSFSLMKPWSDKIRFETDFLHLHENVYIKIFISRNEEYNKKFYSWKWDYYMKEGLNFKNMGSSIYAPISYKSDYHFTIKGMGQGIGTPGTQDYIMIYYRYRVE